MKLFFSIFLLFFAFAGDISSQIPQYVETGRIIVKLNPDAVLEFETKLRTLNETVSDGSILRVGIKSFDDVNQRYRATSMRRVFPDGGKFEAKHRKYGLHLWYELIIPDGEDPEMVAKDYGMDENVQIAEPRYKIRSLAMPSVSVSAGETPNDPDFFRQWNFDNTVTPGADIRLLEAWEKVKSMGIRNNNVIVAVVDDGVYYDHEDLKENMWENIGFNFVGNNGTIIPEEHGTHVAGVIGAVTDNGIGVSGIAGNPSEGYGIKIMSIQILEGDRSVLDIGPAFVYAADNGAVISQNSWTYRLPNEFNQLDLDAINYFIKEAGRDEYGNPRPNTPMVGGIVIFAAGNERSDDKWYPAYFDNVIAVAATNRNGQLARYSNFGNWIDISAPGGEFVSATNRTGGIYSTSYRSNNKNYYEYMQGTSMASPHVAGVAALILSVYGSECYTPEMLRARLLYPATPLNIFDPVNASNMGAGLVNASAALTPNNALEKVTDLSAQPINAVSCSLIWTVPQVENNSELIYYTVAAATEEITEENFNRHIFTSVAVSQTVGVAVSGLNPDTQYYMAIRNSDQCYTSEISNVATITTRINRPPEVLNPLPKVGLRDVANETAFYIGDVFTDPDGDEMAYEISGGNVRIATARLADDMLLIRPIAAGETIFTLTADDGNTGRTTESFSLVVTQNQAPVFDGLVTELILIPSSEPIIINMEDYAYDPEGDYPLSFNTLPIRNDIIKVEVAGNTLTIDPQRHGNVALQVRASDAYLATSTATINITVEQKYAPDKYDELLVYPNPTNDILWYSFILNDKTASIIVRITDSSGRTVYQTPAENLSEGVHYNNVNIQSWSSGTYFVQLIRNDVLYDTKQIVKQ